MNLLNDKEIDDLFENSDWETFIVEDKNKELKSIDEKRIKESQIEESNLNKNQNIINKVKDKISLNIIKIIKTNEKDVWRKLNRLVLIVGFIIVLCGIPCLIYKFLNNYYFVYKLYKEKNNSWIDILVILYSSWKLIHLTLTKIVDYVFVADNALLTTMTELVKLDYTNNIKTIKNLEVKEEVKEENLFHYILKRLSKKRT